LIWAETLPVPEKIRVLPLVMQPTGTSQNEWNQIEPKMDTPYLTGWGLSRRF
jgi:hypothetical protein